jgi:hypothetical protein
MEKPSEEAICSHMIKKYTNLFKTPTKKPFICSKKGFENVEHYNRIVNLNAKILDIGTVIFKQFQQKVSSPFNAIAHPAYRKRFEITRLNPSPFLENLSLKHSKLPRMYEGFLKK